MFAWVQKHNCKVITVQNIQYGSCYESWIWCIATITHRRIHVIIYFIGNHHSDEIQSDGKRDLRSCEQCSHRRACCHRERRQLKIRTNGGNVAHFQTVSPLCWTSYCQCRTHLSDSDVGQMKKENGTNASFESYCKKCKAMETAILLPVVKSADCQPQLY